MHDTVGIIYQTVSTQGQLDLLQSSDDVNLNNQYNQTSICNLQGRRKRSYEPENFENLSLAKQVRPQFWHSSVQDYENPINLDSFYQINFMWLLCQILKRYQDTHRSKHNSKN